jgi:surface antigen
MKVLALALAITLVGCATQPQTIPASYLSGSFGSLMDASDHARANEVLEGGSENQPVSWVNPRSGKRFTVSPTRTFKKGELDCRDFRAIYGGRTLTGTACRQENGIWISK